MLAAALLPHPPALIRPGGMVRAERYAAHRRGTVAFAVVGADRRVRGLRVSERFPSASVVKAMLLVARLRDRGSRPLTAADRAALRPMIERSDNRAAEAMHGIIAPQRWGIAPVARRRGLKAFFKGGWRTGIVHQVALLEHNGHRVALAILTRGESMAYGEATLAGIARRLLR